MEWSGIDSFVFHSGHSFSFFHVEDDGCFVAQDSW